MTEFSHCPDCSAPLGKERLKCRCGWAAPAVLAREANPNHIQCSANHSCRYPGRMKIDGKPVCVEHYCEDPRRFKA